MFPGFMQLLEILVFVEFPLFVISIIIVDNMLESRLPIQGFNIDSLLPGLSNETLYQGPVSILPSCW